MKEVLSTKYIKEHHLRECVDEETVCSMQKRSVSNTEGTKDNIT